MRTGIALGVLSMGWVLGLAGDCAAQIGWATPVATISTPNQTVTPAALKPADGMVNGYSGIAAFGKIAAGFNGAVALEGTADAVLGANPSGGPNVWIVYGGGIPPNTTWTVSALMPNMPPGSPPAYSADHGLAWRRYGRQYVSRGADTVIP